MTEILVECPECRRHVFADEGQCPFCHRGRVSRTVAALAAAGLTLSGCDNLRALFAPSSNTLYGGVEVNANLGGPDGAVGPSGVTLQPRKVQPADASEAAPTAAPARDPE